MTLLVHVLAAAAVASSTSGTSLIMNEATVPVEVGGPLQLDCGVEGHYRLCLWETKDGRIFLVEDVYAGRYEGLSAPQSLTHNQCGIVVEKSSVKDLGEWTCHVLLDGDGVALKGVKTVGQACTLPFESLGTGCFYFGEAMKSNWEDARTFCKSLSAGADLAVLHDCHQHQLVWNHIVLNYGVDTHWIGARDPELQGTFLWVDGTVVSMGMPFWLPDQPSGGDGCVEMSYSTGYFNDYPCTIEYNFVCQQL